MQDRIKPLQGVANFRDFGDYHSDHGGRVRRGVLYRSAHFAEATDPDIGDLNGLGVSLLVDLRRPEERAADPNRWPGAPVRFQQTPSRPIGVENAQSQTFRPLSDGKPVSTFPDSGQVTVLTNDLGVNTPPPHLAAADAADWSPAGVDGYMRATYAAYPFEARYVDLFSGFLRGLADGEGAAVVHCAAGKDRTGCLSALTLRLVGVTEDDAVADYLITNQTIDWSKRLPKMREHIAARYGEAPSDDALKTMLGVKADYLASYFAAIGQEFASLERYAEAVLDLDAARLARLRTRLVG